MATRMSSKKTIRPKTLNRGATDDRTRILAYLRKRNDKVFSRAWKFKKNPTDSFSQALQEINASLIDAVYNSRSEDIAWIENISHPDSDRGTDGFGSTGR